jgi:hypothetical protein
LTLSTHYLGLRRLRGTRALRLVGVCLTGAAAA